MLFTLFIPKTNFGQAPTLGTTSGFTLFTASGAFGNTGTTVITGDIGTNVGAFTGFPPGTLNGTSHVADSVSALAAVDVDTAYNELGALTCDSTIGATLGGGQSLFPKIYCITSLASLNGILYLDGNGDTNSVFIFKINGALSASTNSTIKLTNSTLLKNVYWQINGAFTLGDSSIFVGTVIANGAISLLQGATLYGRGLSISGAISLNTTINSLPVELVSCNAYLSNQNVFIKWSTTSEINNDYYSIERKVDNDINWQLLGKVYSVGNSTTLRNYSFTDQNPNKGISYYRLKQTDLNGNFKLFNILVINNSSENLTELSVYPNPSAGVFNFGVIGNQDQIHSISIYNTLGKKVYASECIQPTANLSAQPNGIYFLQYNLNGKMITQKLQINK